VMNIFTFVKISVVIAGIIETSLAAPKNFNGEYAELLPSNNKSSNGQSFKFDSLTSKIIGGQDAYAGEFPWQVSIQLDEDSRSSFPICGGTIISPTEILTAAHCLFYGINDPIPLSSLTVVAGAHSVFNPDGSEQIVGISSKTVHSDFDLSNYNNDIALLRLSSSLTYNSRVNSIKITEDNIIIGSCIAIGWGNIRNDGGVEYPEVLQKVSLDIVERNLCKEAYDSYNEVTEGMLCASRQGKGTCLGDSGSGFICTNNAGEKYLAGIVSWGVEPCAVDESLPSVFTNIIYYSSWIGKNSYGSY